MIGKTVLNYTIQEIIGTGGFGTVYKCVKENPAGTYVRALKHISLPTEEQYYDVLNSMGGNCEKADDYFSGILKDIVSEIQILNSLSEYGVKNVVAYYENEIEESKSPLRYDIYILMEYLTVLTKYMREHSVAVKDIIRLGRDISGALQICHENGIIHRDIKDSNIFVAQNGMFKLGDFGVSKVLQDRSRAETMAGTMNFIAPEVYLGKEQYDCTVDIYSLGIVMYRLLNYNRNPFMPKYPDTYTNRDEEEAFACRMRKEKPDFPVNADNRLGEAVIRALLPRSQRYNDAAEFLEELHAAERELSDEELNKTVMESLSNPSAVYTQAHKNQSWKQNGGVCETVKAGVQNGSQSSLHKERPNGNLFETMREGTEINVNDILSLNPNGNLFNVPWKGEVKNCRKESESEKKSENVVNKTLHAESLVQDIDNTKENEKVADILEKTDVILKPVIKNDGEKWKDIISVSCGGRHTVGLKMDGTVVATGDNKTFGECEVDSWKSIVDVSCGEHYTAGLKADGTVVVAGDIDTEKDCKTEDWDNVAAIFCDAYRIAGLKRDGTVVTAGRNEYGCCDVENWNNITAVSFGYHHTVGLKKDGTVVAVGRNECGCCNVENWDNIIAISCGNMHTAGLKADGTVLATGENKDGCCNVEDWKDIIDISCSYNSTIGLQKDGTVVAMGKWRYGVERWKKIVSILSASCYIVGLRKDGTVLSTGYNLDGECNVEDWTDIVSISCGSSCTIGIKKDRTVVAVGDNKYGQCNVREQEMVVSASCENEYADGIRKRKQTAEESVPAGNADKFFGSKEIIIAGADQEKWQNDMEKWAKVVSVSGGCTYYRYVFNAEFMAGMQYDGRVITAGNDYSLKNAEKWEKIISISCGKEHIAGLQKNGTIVATGSNCYGQCDVEKWRDIVVLACGMYYTAGLRSDGTIVAAGKNEEGQCNIEGWKNIVSVSCGNEYTVGLRQDGTIAATGENEYGQCDVSKWKDVVFIDCGDRHTVGLQKNGTVVATGNNLFRQCDVKFWQDIVAIACGKEHTAGLRKNGTVIATGPHASRVEKWRNIIAISCGAYHTAGLMRDGKVVVEGNNSRGCTVKNSYHSVEKWENIDDVFCVGRHIIGIKTKSKPGWQDIVTMSCGVNHIAGLHKNGTVVAAGRHDFNQCSVRNWNDMVTVSCGLYHTAGLKKDGTVIVAGKNTDEQCNTGEWSGIISLSCGYYYTAGLRKDGTVIIAGDENMRRDVMRWKNMEAIFCGAFLMAGLRKNGTVDVTGMYRFLVSNDDVHIRRKNKAKEQSHVEKNENGERVIHLDKEEMEEWKRERQKQAQKLQMHISKKLETWRDIVSISCGNDFIAGLRRNGTVVIAGDVGLRVFEIKTWKNIISISCENNYIAGLRKDGTVVAAAVGSRAMVGTDDSFLSEVKTWCEIVSISCCWNYIAGLRKDGTVVAAGSNQYGQCDVSMWKDIVAIFSCWNFMAGLQKDGTVVVAGKDLPLKWAEDGVPYPDMLFKR